MSKFELKPLRRTPPNHLIPFLPRWQSNNNPNDLGVVRFIFDLYEFNKRKNFPPLIRDFNPAFGAAPWVKDALYEYHIYEPGMTKEDRCHVFATYREGSKTFWFAFALLVYETVVGQYGIYFNDYLLPEVDYQVLRGKTGKEAKKKLLNVISFINNRFMVNMFGELRPSFKDVKDKVGKDESTFAILKNGYIFEAGGIDQPIRGFNVMQVRPKKITFDDPENRENTKTEDRRKSNSTEVMEESFGAVHDYGTIIYIGNKIHADDTIGKLLDKENKQWKKHFYTLTYSRGPNGTKIPGKGNLLVELPDWPLRDTITKIIRRKEWFERQPKLGGVRGFLKEYYNIIKSEADFKIKEWHGEYVRDYGVNWLKVATDKGFEYRNVNIYIGCDPAISEKKLSSDAVVTALAVDSWHRRYVLEISAGKFDINDRFLEATYTPPNVVCTKPEEIANIVRIGSSDEIIRKYLRYNANGISVETYGQQLTFYNETKNKLERLGKRPIMLPYQGGADSKITRDRQLPLAYFESGHYYIKDDMPEKENIKNEVETFPFSKLDRLDSLHIAEQLVIYPKRLEHDSLGNFVLEEERKKQDIHKVIPGAEPWIVA